MAGVAEEAAVAALAAQRQGMVTTEDLLAAGFSRGAIARRVAGGWLVRRHRGVYQLGVFAGPYGTFMAALLACGPGTVLSHWAAAALWGLRAWREGLVDVSMPGGIPGSRAGIRRHRAGGLHPGDIVIRHGMRVTTPARTLLDLAAVTPRRELERLVEEAQVQRLVTRGELLAMVHRGAGRPGVTLLREIVGADDEPSFTRSEAERRLVELIRAAGLPRPRTNVRIDGLEVDAAWPAQRLVVEVDGFAYHGITRTAFERDRRRDGQLLLAGYRVVRVTWLMLVREPERVIALVAAALRSR